MVGSSGWTTPALTVPRAVPHSVPRGVSPAAGPAAVDGPPRGQGVAVVGAGAALLPLEVSGPVGRGPVDWVAEAVGDCPAIAGLDRGGFGVIATYPDGGTGQGQDAVIEIHISGRLDRPAADVRREVRDAARKVVPNWTVVVRVRDDA